MSLTSAQRIWIAAGLLAIAASLIAVPIYLRFTRRAVQSPAMVPELAANPPTPQQTEQTQSVLNELPGGAPAIAYLDVQSQRKIPSSPIVALLGLTAPSPPSQDQDYRQFVRETGFDYTRDLDRVAIAFWPARSEGDGQSLDDNRAFVVADGRWDEKRIAAYARKRGMASAQGNRTIYEIPGKPPVALEFISPARIALASGTNSAELLVGPHSRIDPGMQARLDRLAGAPLFAVARIDSLPSGFYARFKNSPQLETLARSVKTADLAAEPQGDVLKVALEGETSSAKDSLAITTVLEISRLGASMALSGRKNGGPITSKQAALLEDLLGQLRISRQGRSVFVRLDLTRAMWTAALSAAPARH